MDHHELETQRLEMELADWLSEKDQKVQAAAESSDDALEDSDSTGDSDAEMAGEEKATVGGGGVGIEEKLGMQSRHLIAEENQLEKAADVHQASNRLSANAEPPPPLSPSSIPSTPVPPSSFEYSSFVPSPVSPAAKARAEVATLHFKLHGQLRRLEEEKSIHVEHRDIKKIKALKANIAETKKEKERREIEQRQHEAAEMAEHAVRQEQKAHEQKARAHEEQRLREEQERERGILVSDQAEFEREQQVLRAQLLEADEDEDDDRIEELQLVLRSLPTTLVEWRIRRREIEAAKDTLESSFNEAAATMSSNGSGSGSGSDEGGGGGSSSEKLKRQRQRLGSCLREAQRVMAGKSAEKVVALADVVAKAEDSIQTLEAAEEEARRKEKEAKRAREVAILDDFLVATGGGGLSCIPCGGGWKNKKGWGSSMAPWVRFGVTVDDEGFVTGLELPNNRLRGTVPNSLGELSRLKVVNFQGNPKLIGGASVLRRAGFTQKAIRAALDSEARAGDAAEGVLAATAATVRADIKEAKARQQEVAEKVKANQSRIEPEATKKYGSWSQEKKNRQLYDLARDSILEEVEMLVAAGANPCYVSDMILLRETFSSLPPTPVVCRYRWFACDDIAPHLHLSSFCLLCTSPRRLYPTGHNYTPGVPPRRRNPD